MIVRGLCTFSFKGVCKHYFPPPPLPSPHADVDECQNSTHDCNQHCINTIGSYECSCDNEGFVLSEDGHSCLGKLIIVTLLRACVQFTFKEVHKQ